MAFPRIGLQRVCLEIAYEFRSHLCASGSSCWTHISTSKRKAVRTSIRPINPPKLRALHENVASVNSDSLHRGLESLLLLAVAAGMSMHGFLTCLFSGIFLLAAWAHNECFSASNSNSNNNQTLPAGLRQSLYSSAWKSLTGRCASRAVVSCAYKIGDCDD